MHFFLSVNKSLCLCAMCVAICLVALPVSSAAFGQTIRVKLDSGKVEASNHLYRFEMNLRAGLWDAGWFGPGVKTPAVRGASCSAKLSDGTDLDLSAYSEHRCEKHDVTSFADAVGHGTEVVVHHRTIGKPELRQCFRFYPDLAYFLIRLEIVGAETLASNNITPLEIADPSLTQGGIHLDEGGVPRVLYVPYDNDAFVRYNADNAPMSYEVTAVYDNTGRHGFVFGSVNHEVWKTGIVLGKPEERRLGNIRVFGGASQGQTHSTLPHGAVAGKEIASPFVFVGFFPDWRNGLETYGAACARFQPPLPWKEGVPFGWNSWSAYQAGVSAEKVCAVSDFLKESVQKRGFVNRGSLYVNLDSFWDNLSEARIVDTVRHIRANGQKPGIYWTPFVCWGGDLNRPVEGTDGKYSYRDILLKGPDGKPVPPLDGGMPLDPSHPGTLLRIDRQLRQFVDWGFDYVKLDFLTHGALEGAHFDPSVRTGNAAYTLGMKRLVADLDPVRIGRPFFISLSIAPLFPAGFGHSRRFACDTWGELSNVEYMLNSLAYGWWASGTLYCYNDPDHTVVCQKQPKTMEQEGRSRLNASVIGGTVLLDGDDLTEQEARNRAEKFLTNPEILDLARAGKSFRPVEGDTGSRAPDVFVREDRETHTLYVAVFNFSKTASITKTLDCVRLGLRADAEYRMHDLWTKKSSVVKSVFSITLEPAESTIIAVNRNP